MLEVIWDGVLVKHFDQLSSKIYPKFFILQERYSKSVFTKSFLVVTLVYYVNDVLVSKHLFNYLLMFEVVL